MSPPSLPKRMTLIRPMWMSLTPASLKCPKLPSIPIP